MRRNPINGPVVLVEDDAQLRMATAQTLELSGLEVKQFDNATKAARYLVPSFTGCVVTDIRMDGMDGLQLFARINALDPEIPVVLITGHGDINMAVRAMQDGAFDFLAKPFAAQHLAAVARKALQSRQLVLDNRALRHALSNPDTHALTQSPAMTQLYNMAGQLARAEIDVSIEGESGTGKEMLARRIHSQSARYASPFLAISCSSPHSPIDFATLSAQIAGGFLFLDGITNLPLPVQAELAAFLDARDRARLNGASQNDFRLISSTQLSLSEGLALNVLGETLFHRLGSVSLRVPPLRERREDIPMLFAQFVREVLDQTGKKRFEMNATDRKRLLEHDWPGNVRELRNYAFTAVLNLPRDKMPAAQSQVDLHTRVGAFERMVIVEALEATGGNVIRACAILKTPRKTLYEKLAKHQIDPDRFRSRNSQ
jgi:two-component system C4-dicarboxylate transport response regulator DctD